VTKWSHVNQETDERCAATHRVACAVWPPWQPDVSAAGRQTSDGVHVQVRAADYAAVSSRITAIIAAIATTRTFAASASARNRCSRAM
jgi:hypothetical protein